MQPFQFPNTLSVNPIERSRYLLPAITVTFGIAVWFLTRSGTGTVDFLLLHQKQPAILYFAVAVIAILLIFTIGHILDLSSQFILERLYSDKLGGFPHERIVPIEATTPRYTLWLDRKHDRNERVITFYKGTKIALTAVSLFVLCQIFFRAPKIQENSDAAFFFLITSYYWALAILAGILSIMPALLVGYLPGSSPSDNYRKIEKFFVSVDELRGRSIFFEFFFTIYRVIFRILQAPAIYSFDSVDRFVRAAFRLNTEIDVATFKNFAIMFQRRFEIDFTSIGNNDRFWLPYLALIHSKSDVLRPITELRSLANFCRNQALALFITSIVLASSYNLEQKSVSEFITKNDTYNIALLFYLLSWVFYWKFLQTYYAFSKMTFRAFAMLPLFKKSSGILQKDEDVKREARKLKRRKKI